MTWALFATVVLAAPSGALANPIHSSAPGVEVVHRTQIGPLKPLLHAYATCPNGLSLIANYDGDLSVVDRQGSVLSWKTGDPNLAGLSAMTCDYNGIVHISVNGWLRSFTVTSIGDLVLQRTFRVTGLPNELLVTPNDELFIVGIAKIEGAHVFLRRFRLSDGSFLDVPSVDVPVKTAAGFNRTAIAGRVYWDRWNKAAMYLPAALSEIWRIQGDGKAVRADLPPPDGAPRAALSTNSFNPPRASGIETAGDKVLGVASLSDGRIVLQVAPARDPAGQRAGWKYSYLDILNPSNFQSLNRIYLRERLGVLTGVDTDDNLHFVNLLAVQGGSLLKVRLVEPRGLTPSAPAAPDRAASPRR